MKTFYVLDCTINKFLNRILGLEVHQQNFLFQYFIDNFEYLIDKDKKEGKYDMGILGKQLILHIVASSICFWKAACYIQAVVMLHSVYASYSRNQLFACVDYLHSAF